MPVGWDQAVALERVGGDLTLLLELTAIFFEDYPAHLACLVQSLAQEDYRTLRKAAHTLKGGLGYIGATEGETLALHIEQASHDRNATLLRELVPSLAAYVEALRQEMFSPAAQLAGAIRD